MEEKTEFRISSSRGGERSTKDVYAEIKNGSSKRWTIQSQKSKYVNGKLSGVIGVGYTASINNSDFLLKEDKSNNEMHQRTVLLAVLLELVYLLKTNLAIK